MTRKSYGVLFVYLAFACVALLTKDGFGLDWGFASINHDYYDADRHNPFNQDPTFIGGSLDFSGIGVFGNGSDRYWLTMISDRYFLSSWHVGVEGQHPVYFFHGNDSSDSENTLTDPNFGYRVDGSDLWLGRLLSTPSPDIKRYPLIKRPESTNYVSFIDRKIYLVGHRFGEHGYDQTRLGLNDIDYRGISDGMYYYSYGYNSGYEEDEAVLIDKDSSGPSFVESVYGGLAIAGIHKALETDSSVSAHITTLSSLAGVNIVTDLLGDVNSDFKIDATDFSTVYYHMNQGPGKLLADGDINGDGFVNSTDLAYVTNYKRLVSSDFNQDGTVDRFDMQQIGNNWHTSVTEGTAGDANRDGYVDGHDIDVLNDNWLFGVWSTSYPTSPPAWDVNQDGLVDVIDQNIIATCLSSVCPPGTSGRADVDGDSDIDFADYNLVLTHWDATGPADINLDKKVNNADLAVVLTNWGTTTYNGKTDGDFNGDTAVNAADFAILTNWWGRGVTSSSQQPALGLVPEPSATLFAFSALLRAFLIRETRQ